jgi:signal transduction histidine kinase
MIKSNSSIRVKILFYLILFSVFILLLLWATQLVLSNYLYEKYQMNDMNKIAEEIKDTDYEDLNEYLEKVVYHNSVCIEFVDRFGSSTLYNDTLTGCLLGRGNKVLLKHKKSLFDSRKDVDAIRLVNPDYKSSALLYGVEVDGGYVFLFSMLSNVNKNDNLVKDQLIYITVIVIILAVVLSIVLSKMFSEPIVGITDKAKLLANGNFNVEFEKGGVKEIDELADTLNYLKSEVSKTDQYRRDLMANVSHDLKTPLTMIKAYAEMVRDITYKDKEKMEDNLNVIIDETDRLNLLVGDILALSKLKANSDVLELEVFNLKDEIDGILKRYDYLKETEGYEIVVNVPDQIIVRVDKKKLNQVIYNLINNALNYTGNDKKVRLNIIENKKEYLVEIVDSGKGIDAKDIEHIWDKYYKKDKNHRRNVVGTGLGLSIVKEILESHNMSYGVKSVKNKGTTFYFKITKENIKK